MEIIRVTKNFRNKKACGKDSIPNELYKIASNEEAYKSKFNITLIKILNDVYFKKFLPEE